MNLFSIYAQLGRLKSSILALILGVIGVAFFLLGIISNRLFSDGAVWAPAIILSSAILAAFGLLVIIYIRNKADEKHAEYNFQLQQKRLDAALSIMPQGFCIYDKNDKIIISNDRYATIYNLKPERVKIGTSLNQVMERRIQQGCFSGKNPDEYRKIMHDLRSKITGAPEVLKLNNGRYVKVHNLPMTDGDWLTIHEDVTERTEFQLALDLQNHQFNTAISNISQGICLFDSEKNLIVSNDQYATIFGLTPDMITPGMKLSEIIQLRFKHGRFTGEKPESFQNRADEWIDSLFDYTEVHKMNDGRYVEILFHPMEDGGWLATQDDVTERTKAKLVLALQNHQFDMAISNISQGLCLFDADKKLIVSNDLYATIFGLSPDIIQPGMHIREIVELRIEKGTFVDEKSLEAEDTGTRADKWRSRFTDESEIVQLTDGRYIEILFRPMNDGGWLSTQQDVTDRIIAEQELTHRNDRLDAALGTMNHGLCMLDGNMDIVISNDQYAEIYGIDPKVITPGTNLREILELRISNGNYPGDNPEKYRQERIDWMETRDNTVKISRLNDGRYIEVRDHPMANDGWLSIHEDVTDRHLTERKIQHLATYDTLTELPNRIQINEILRSAIDTAMKNDTKMALLYIDLDGFKEVNDTLGHPVGDLVLEEVGQRLTKILSKNIVAGRLSGDEFVVVVKNFDEQSYLSELGEKVCSLLAAPIQINHDEIDISASVGIAIGPPANGEVDTLIQFSDLALYQAKADGGDSFRFFEEQMYVHAKERQRLATDLRSAIRNNELYLHYQPQINLVSGEINGYEALIRWQHPQLGVISPYQFIGIAEETGQICEIGEWVLKTACEYAVNWPNQEKISVNLSPVQFKRQDVVAMVHSALKETGLAPERLELEITESVLIQNADSVLVTLQTLAYMGVSIALDDFGIGYSSLSYLTTFPFNKIKIDKSFVDELGKNSEVTAIISMVINLGRSLNTIITAEGIEDPIQHELLRAAGCDQGQGYLYGRPEPKILSVRQPDFVRQA